MSLRRREIIRLSRLLLRNRLKLKKTRIAGQEAANNNISRGIREMKTTANKYGDLSKAQLRLRKYLMRLSLLARKNMERLMSITREMSSL